MVLLYIPGKIITAAYVPLPNYHALFPDALRAVQLLLPSTQSVNAATILPTVATGIPQPVPPITQNMPFM